MELATMFGYGAGFLTTAAFVPQVVQIWRSRSARDISLHTFGVFTVGIALWIAFGVLKQEWPIVVWNGITFVLAGMILAMKVRFG